MKTVADPRVLRSLVERLGRLRSDSERRWGTLTAHEMLCHLGDTTAMVLGTRPKHPPSPVRQRRLVRWLGLWAPVPWPHGWRAAPSNDPKAAGTRPTDFAKDLARAVEGLEGIAAAAPGSLVPAHGFFGTMSVRDWQRWAYRHTEHHLRQFGV
ncbi:MAG TPA: DinB family protein [Longimicrobiaceae bacterium]|nr:DinB family protein [Longimicrobiaceae bacterium]